MDFTNHSIKTCPRCKHHQASYMKREGYFKVLTCYRCGYLHGKYYSGDETEENKPEITGISVYCYGNGFYEIYSLDYTIDDAIVETFKESIKNSNFEAESCYLTRWNLDKEEIEILIGNEECIEKMFADDSLWAHP